VRKLMDDVKSVQWLPLERAIATLTHAHEQAFLAQVGPVALQAAERSAGDAPVGAEAGGPAARGAFVNTLRAWYRRLTRQA
jgi:8-oxo-dGTP diphosphatase